jgi:ankyrin repeat protein
MIKINIFIISIILIIYNNTIYTQSNINISNNKKESQKHIHILYSTNFADIYFKKALKFACQNDDITIINLLYNRGFDINNLFIQNHSPLMLASKFNSLKVVKYLIQKGADINLKNNYNKTALIVACENLSIETIEYLLSLENIDLEVKSHMLQSNAFITACISNNLKVAKMLLDKKADINTKYIYERNALMYACYTANYDLVTFLLKNGINVNTQDRKGDSALIFAVRYSQLKFIKKLVEYNADINIKNNLYEDALKLACKYNKYDIVKYLIKIGAQIDKSNQLKQNTIIYACKSGSPRIFSKILKTYNKDIMENNELIYLLLKTSIYNSHFKLLKFIIFIFLEKLIDQNSLVYKKIYKKYNRYKIIDPISIYINNIAKIKNSIKNEGDISTIISDIEKNNIKKVIIYALSIDYIIDFIIEKNNYMNIYKIIEEISYKDKSEFIIKKIEKIKKKIAQRYISYNIFSSLYNKQYNDIFLKIN